MRGWVLGIKRRDMGGILLCIFWTTCIIHSKIKYNRFTKENNDNKSVPTLYPGKGLAVRLHIPMSCKKAMAVQRKQWSTTFLCLFPSSPIIALFAQVQREIIKIIPYRAQPICQSKLLLKNVLQQQCFYAFRKIPPILISRPLYPPVAVPISGL